MSPAARLQAAFDLYLATDSDTRPVDAVTSGWFRSRRDINEADRGVILDWLYDLLRHRARLAWWLDRHGRDDNARNRYLTWLTLVEGKQADFIRRAIIDLDAQENSLLTKLQGGTFTHPDMPEAVRLECPAWAEAALRERFGDRFAAEMQATLTPPPLDLRVNTIKSTPKAIMRALNDLGLPAKQTKLSPLGIRVNERFSLARFAALKAGEVEIQDEGSQLVAMLLDAQPKERVVDFCAGAGGKTLAIGAQMENKGRILACDVNEGRLTRCAERVRKAGLHNVETKVLASETDKWIKRQKGTYDRVLIDAPCSGTGTWRRNPDARWRETEGEGLDNLLALQGRILTSAARLVKAGGRLIYATCSLLPQENEAQVNTFLAANPAFRLVPLADVAPDLAAHVDGDYLSLSPARHNTDGFFAAVMQREAPTA